MEDNLKQLDYVISAYGMLGVFTPEGHEPWYPEFKDATLSLMTSLKKRIAESCTQTKPLISTLFNAYTEKNHVAEFKRYDNMGSDSVYADSGGLQMVTAGKEVTEEIKDKIYETQSYADYAMCFDVIALRSTSKTRTRNERSNTSNKIFMSKEHAAAARATGLNIKRQASYFRSIGAKTKVIIIVQGNNSQDMVDFYRGIESVLDPEDYDNIGGMAIADTCMGNGELESIEMLVAAKLISEFCHANVRKHLHVLGVGSIARMRPILYLLKSKYLDAFERVSYDSSSHTSTFQYGLLKLDGGCKSIGSHYNPKVDKHFRNVYRLFSDTFSRYMTEDEFINAAFEDGVDWKYSTIKNRVMSSEMQEKVFPALLISAAHTYYQIHNFVTNLDKVYTNEYDVFPEGKITKRDIALNKLLGVTTTEQMQNWMYTWQSHVETSRIARDENTYEMESFENV